MTSTTTDNSPADTVDVELGDITELAGARFPDDRIDGGTRIWSFTLTEAKVVGLGLRQLDADADLILEDADGNVIAESRREGTSREWISTTLLAGDYRVRVVAQEDGVNDYKFRYGVSAADSEEVARLQQEDSTPGDPPVDFNPPVDVALGDITDLVGARFPDDRVDAGTRTWTFTLTEAKVVGLGLRRLDADADLVLEDAGGNVIAESRNEGTANEWISTTLLAGDYRVRVVAQEDGVNDYKFRYGVSAADSEEVARLRQEDSTQDDPPAEDGPPAEDDPPAEDGPPAEDDPPAENDPPAEDDPLEDPVVVTVVAPADDDPDGVEPRVSLRQESTSDTPDTDIPDTVATTATVAVGGSVTGDVETGGDRDWYAVTLVAGRTYRFDLEGTATRGGTLRDPHLYGIHDSEGTYIEGTTDFDGGVSTNSRLEFTATASGVHHVSVGADDQYRNPLTGTYRLSVTDATPASEDIPDTTDTTASVGVGGSADGDIEVGGDRDWYAVTLVAGRTYRFDLEGTWTDAGTNRDPYLRGIHDAEGSYIEGTRNDDGGVRRNSQLEFTATASGVHYVSAGAHRDNTGTYRLSVTDITPEDPPTATPPPAVLGDGPQPGTDPLVRLVTFITETDPGDDEPLVSAQQQSESPDDYSAGTDTTGRVAVRGSVLGDIELPGDRDWFAVTLEAGRAYRIDLEGYSESWTSGQGRLFDPYLAGVHDGEGNLLPGTSDDDTGGGLYPTWRSSRVVFVPENDGTYYIAAAGNGSGASPGGGHSGTYRLSVTEIATFTDDYPAASPGTVTVNGSATGNIESLDDQDWFAVTLEAGKSYRIDLEGSPTGQGTLSNPYLRGIHDGDGELIARTSDNDDGTGANSRVFFTPETGGIYHIAAGSGGFYYRGVAYLREAGEHRHYDATTHADYQEGRTGTYRLSVREAVDDHRGGTDTTATVIVDDPARGGRMDFPRDQDWFAVSLSEGKGYSIVLRGGSPTDPGDLSAYISGVHDGEGNPIVDNSGDYLNLDEYHRLVFTPDDSGRFYIAVSPYGLGYGTYHLSVSEIADDYSDTPGTVVVGGSTTGYIEFPADRDWFAVSLTAGTTYRIDMEGRVTRELSLIDPYLRDIRDDEGNPIAGTADDNGGAGNDSRAFFMPETTGTYHIVAGSGGGLTGRYRVSVRVAEDDHPASTDTTATVAVDGSATGDIEHRYDEEDWFAVDLLADTRYRIDLEGSHTGQGTLSDPHLRGIYDDDGSPIADTDDANGGEGRNSRLFFTPETDGTYYIAAGAGGGRAGTYRVSVMADDHPDGAGTTSTVAVGASATGDIEHPDDRDWFAVQLEAGRSYRIDLEGSWTDAGTLPDPFLHGIHDRDGNPIAGTSDDQGGYGRNSRVYFSPETDGTYYVAAGTAGGRIPTGTYRVSVTEIADDFPAGTDTTGTVEVGGSATGDIERRDDRDWFAVELEANTRYRIDLEGRPTDAGTLRDPYLRGVHDGDGNPIAGTSDTNGGEGRNSRLFFTPETGGTYYIAAGATYGSDVGTYTLEVEEVI